MAPTLFMNPDSAGPRADQGGQVERHAGPRGQYGAGQGVDRAARLEAAAEHQYAGHGDDRRVAEAREGSR